MHVLMVIYTVDSQASSIGRIFEKSEVSAQVMMLGLPVSFPSSSRRSERPQAKEHAAVVGERYMKS